MRENGRAIQAAPGSLTSRPDGRRLRIEIQGAVQGVGFRPFVYRLATEMDLAGWVINDTRGVFIEVEGEQGVLESFLLRLPAEQPPRAIVHNLRVEWLEPVGFERFEIRHSDNQGSKTVLVLPDIATCPECLAELLDPANRRYRYPFTNCTNCGPRFTIIESLPYDRPNTTMRRFALCPECQAEYENPLDRRFHAQPNACAVCGPSLAFYQRSSEPADLQTGMSGGKSEGSGSTTWPAVYGDWSLAATRDDALRSAAAALRSGRIVAVKGLGGFHLMADARNAAAIGRLRAGKPRREKPFALMARDLEQARQLGEISEDAADLLVGPESPIVLLRRLPGAPVAGEVAPGNPYLGVMLPYTPLHHLLLREIDFPVVATSGNLTDEPICTDSWEAFERLGHLADDFLVHDRPIERHVDDSVVTVMAGAPRLLRRARGFAPLPVLLKEDVPTILAAGAQLKNTVALSVGRRVFISQHIGDLETPEALAAFERVIADFLRLYEVAPVAIAHDLHPDYLSTRWAGEWGSRGADGLEGSAGLHKRSAPPQVRLVPVQHHHAHLASCLAENRWDGPALGVTWDGTGYGTDGTMWGGEFLLGDAGGYTRVAHLRPFRLPGGEAAIHEPARLALALLWELYGEEAFGWEDLPSVQAFRPGERRILGQMLRRGTNAPITTGAGRLFDGVAALAGLYQRVNFEGQAAMALEFAADASVRDAYPLALVQGRDAAGEQERTRPGAMRAGGGSGRAGMARADNGEGAEHGQEETVSSRRSRSSAPLLLDWAPAIEAVLRDMRGGVPAGTIAARFHNALVEGIVTVAFAVGHPVVALTGGCFQNRRLTEQTAARLQADGFQVLLHRQVPANDGGISLGQAAVAAAQLMPH